MKNDRNGDHMNKKLRHLYSGIIMACLMMVMMPFYTLTAFAAGGRIAFSDRTAEVGSEVSINVKVTTSGAEALSSADVMLSYDPNVLEFVSGTDASGGAGSVRVKIGAESTDAKTLSSTLTFKVLSAGTAKITVSSQEVYDANNQLVTIDQLGSSTVTASAPAGAGTDASLSELKISPGVLTPEFSPEVDTYTAEVGLDVEKITVSAPTTDENARVSITGNEGLQPGENKVVCQVTAEDGTTTKSYTINVSKVEGGASDGGSGSAEEPVSGVDVVTVAKTVTIVPVEEGVEVPKGLAECNIKIDGQDVKGWVWASETDHEYCVFYGMNEAGEKGFYRYDLKEKTMQRYFQDPLASSDVSMDQYVTVAEDYNALLKDYQMRLYMIIALVVLSAALLIAVVILLKKNGSGEPDIYRDRLDDKKVSAGKKSARRMSREEAYLKELEEEEAAAAEEESKLAAAQMAAAEMDKEQMPEFDMMDEELDVMELNDDPMETVPVSEMKKTVPQAEQDNENDDEDDFEFLDIDL